jgi:DNA helicase-2/ATP-dependent DNA helicase PcrA
LLFEAWGENEEAEWIAGRIQALRAKDKNADIGILYRTNAQSRAIEQSLIRNNIPYRIFGGLKFYERREIKDAVSALRYISNAKDEPARERLEKNLTKRRFAEFRNRVAELQDPAKLSLEKIKPLAAIKLFLETFGYFEYLESNFVNSDEREENIAELIAFATDFTSLDELLERLSLLQAADEIENKPVDGREVNLMTIHLAKGLEFDSVFIAGVAEGFLPHGRSLDDENSLEEERRLMYVAMTRARKNLYLSFYGIPSRFVNEIPEDCIVLAPSDGSDDSFGSPTGGANGSRWHSRDAGGDYDDDSGADGSQENIISLD